MYTITAERLETHCAWKYTIERDGGPIYHHVITDQYQMQHPDWWNTMMKMFEQMYLDFDDVHNESPSPA